MSTKIEVIYEKLAVEARGEDEDKLMIYLLKKVHMLEMDRKISISDRDVDYPAYLKASIADVLYYLLKVASKHGACLECMAEIMETKKAFLDAKKEGISVVVPPPTVKNTDNTGPKTK